MATPTYDLLDSTVLTSSASTVTFSGISATGKGDLVLVINAILLRHQELLSITIQAAIILM